MANKTCQSCGMPLSKDAQGGGSNTDGSKSTDYCSHCFVRGAFTQPQLTVGQMQDLVRAKMSDMGFPRWLSWFFVRGIPQLQRWRSA